MQIVGKITDWQLRSWKPGKKTWMRYNAATDSVEFMEEFFEDVPLRDAKIERELSEMSSGPRDLKPLAIVPKSVQRQAILEGWEDDDKQWRRWINDSDNRYLRIAGGRV